MQFRKQPHHFTHRTYLQVVSGVMLMLFGVLYVVSPFSARSQEPTGTPVPVTETAPPTAEVTNTPADTAVPTSSPAAAPEPPTPTAEAPAPAATAPPEEPTATTPPEPTATPLVPTFARVVPAAAPPLTLAMSASAARAGPGQDVRLTAVVSSDSDTPRAVRVEVELDPQLEASSADASSGTCAVGVPVVCNVTVQRDGSATINVIGRVRGEAVAGSQLVSQAVARDDANNTAASDPITVAVSDGLAIVPMARTAIPATPTAAESIAAAPSAHPTDVPQPTQVPTALVPVTTVAPPAPTEKPRRNAPIAVPTAPAETPQRGVSTTDPSPTDASIALAETIAAPTETPQRDVSTTEPIALAETIVAPPDAPTDAPVPTAGVAVGTPPPTDAPAQATPADGIFAAPEGEKTQLATPTPAAPNLQTNHLPDTDSNAPLLGWSSMLLGFALTAHGTRRVRQENTRLAAHSRETRQLEPLVDAIAYLSGTVKDETEQMQRMSEECIELLRDGRS